LVLEAGVFSQRFDVPLWAVGAEFTRFSFIPRKMLIA
jgi:hypothetical protein